VTWKAVRKPGSLAGVQRAVDDVMLYQLMQLANDEHAATEVRALVLYKLKGLKTWAAQQAGTATDGEQRAHLNYAAQLIGRFEENPSQVIKPTEPKEPPPGQPIGEDDFDCGWSGGM